MNYKERLAAAKSRRITEERRGLETGRRSRDAAIDAVYRPAVNWINGVVGLITTLPPGTYFTTDLVWSRVAGWISSPAEPRAMGAAMREAAEKGLIEATGDYQKSARPKCHARPLAVWRRL
jgi:hypothetical protein